MYQAKQKNWQAMKLKTSHLEECISWYFKILRESSGINFVTYSFKTVTQMYIQKGSFAKTENSDEDFRSCSRVVSFVSVRD